MMKLFLLFFFILNHSAFAARRDCVKEAHDFKLAHKISQMWNSDLDWGEKSIAQICKEGNPDVDAIIMFNKIYYKKVQEEYSSKLTITIEESGAWLDEFVDGEVSNEELCVGLDKYVEKWADCTSPAHYLRSIKMTDSKDFEKICLQKLPEQQKRMISCRKK